MTTPVASIRIPRTRYVILGVVFLVSVGLASINRSGGSEGGGIGIGGERGSLVGVLEPRRGPIATTIQAPGTVQAGSEVGLSAPFEGRVLELKKDTGWLVKEDEIIFRLDPEEHQKKLDEATLDRDRKLEAVTAARAELTEAERKATEADKEPWEVTEARLRVTQAVLNARLSKAQLEAADAKLKRARDMLRRRIGNSVDVEAAESEQRVATISVEVKEEELGLARKTLGFRKREWGDKRKEVQKAKDVAATVLTRAESDVETAKVAVARAERDLKRCDVKSPLDGIVTARAVNEGDLVVRLTGSESHYIISDLNRLLVYCDVDEGDVVHVEQGQRARVTVNSLGEDLKLTGKVYSVGYRAQKKQGEEVSSFTVRVELDRGQKELEKLRPGMSANAEIETNWRADVLKVPIQAVVQKDRSKLPDDLADDLPAERRAELDGIDLEEDEVLDVLWVVIDGKAQIRVVKRGLQDASEVEILGGLEEDVEVVIRPHRVLEKLKQGDRLRTEEAKNALPRKASWFATNTPSAAPVGSKD